MSKQIKYVGTSTIREITPAQLESVGVLEHEDISLYIDTRLGQRARVVDVSEATASLLMESEPQDWVELTEEEAALVQASDQAKADKEAAIAQRAETEAAQIEENRQAAEVAARDASQILEGEENTFDPDKDLPEQ